LKGLEPHDFALWWLAYFPSLWIEPTAKTQTEIRDILVSVYNLSPQDARNISVSAIDLYTDLINIPEATLEEISLQLTPPIIIPGTTITPILEPQLEEPMIEEPIPVVEKPPEEPPLEKPRIDLKPLTKKEKEDLRKIRLQLYMGPKEKYRVRYIYPRGPSETLTVEARGFPDAVQKTQRTRKASKYLPSVVDVVRIQ